MVKEETKTKVERNAKRNAQSIGVGLPVILAWAIETYTGVTVPIEVVAAFSSVTGVILGRFGD